MQENIFFHKTVEKPAMSDKLHLRDAVVMWYYVSETQTEKWYIFLELLHW